MSGKKNIKIKRALQALTYGDPSLGLSGNNPLLLEFNTLREGIQQSRDKIQSQNLFFESLIQHLDSIVLVVDDNYKISHKNKDFDQFIGIQADFVNDSEWGRLGSFIMSAHLPSKAVIL